MITLPETQSFTFKFIAETVRKIINVKKLTIIDKFFCQFEYSNFYLMQNLTS